jgi:hypothetical protein
MLAALGVPASPGEFAAVEGILDGSFSKIPEIPVAQVNAVDMTPQEVRDWLVGLPIEQQAELITLSNVDPAPSGAGRGRCTA